MASKILITALLASCALGRAIPETRDVVTIEDREVTSVSYFRFLAPLQTF